MIRKTNLALMTLALAAWASTASAQTLVWSDNSDDNNPIGWTTGGWPGVISEVNQQFVISGTFLGPMPTNNPLDTHVPSFHSIPVSGPIPEQRTLELRVDLVGANQSDAWAGTAFAWANEGKGYWVLMDQDELVLLKFYNSATALACFFYENRPLKNENVTLVLALSRRGIHVEITTRVLDKDNGNAVLFERTVTDTPEADPVLPSRTVRGAPSEPDVPRAPWPLASAPNLVGLSLQWVNSDHGPQPAAQVLFDNLQVWQYESPELAIQKAVVLSWPVTSGQFILQSAPSVNGPWEPVPDPWWRSDAVQNDVCILAPDSMRLFRLRFAP